LFVDDAASVSSVDEVIEHAKEMDIHVDELTDPRLFSPPMATSSKESAGFSS